MTTGAKLGIGTKLAYETVAGASPVAFTNVPQCLDFPDFAEEREFVETTSQDSPDKRREYIGGLIDVVEVEFQMNYLPNDSSQEALRAMINEISPRIWRVSETQSSPEKVFYFRAFVARHAQNGPLGDRRLRSITLRRTGIVTEDVNALL